MSPLKTGPTSSARGLRTSVALLCLGFASLVAQPVQTQTPPPPGPLQFFKNYFITGDYVVAGVGLRGKGQIDPDTGVSLATDSISISGVPVDADVMAAFLYWQVVTTTSAGPDSGSVGVKFKGSPLSTADAPFGKLLSIEGTAPCWASGGSTGSSGGSKKTYTYRADVLRYFEIGPTGKLAVNGLHEVRVPDSGSGGNATPLALGASLVVVYRTPSLLLSAIVIYDGGYTLNNSTPTMNQVIQGFYESANGTGKLTHIVGSGQENKSETILFDGVEILDSSFSGSAGPSWDNPTFGVSFDPDLTQVTTGVYPSSDCLTWGAVIFKTEVKDFDGDGLLDIWETSSSLVDPNGEPLPNLAAMGANKNVKDLFVEIGYMKADVPASYGGETKPAHKHLPSPAALKLVGDAFVRAPSPAGPINVHFDVGDPAAYHAIPGYESLDADSYIIGTATTPLGVPRGGEAINEIRMSGDATSPTAETAQECTYNSTKDSPWRCQFSAYPGTVGWKTGFRFFRDQVIGGEPAPAADAVDPCDAPGNDGPGQSCERRFDRNRKDMFHYALFAHAVGLPKSDLPCLDSEGQPVGDVNGKCAVAVNSLFRTPRTITGVGDFPGGDVMVTLGGFSDLDGRPVGTPFMQASTLMHELGHNLERRHGGDPEEPNCKPTYLSVMNYLYQLRGLVDDSGRPHLDFSRAAIGPDPDLTEASLSDWATIDAWWPPTTDTPRYRIGWYAPLTGSFLDPSLGGYGTAARTHCDGSPLLKDASGAFTEPAMVRIDARYASGAIDWKANGIPDPVGPAVPPPTSFPQDINFDGWSEVLRSTEDWSRIHLNQIGARRSIGGLFVDFTGQLFFGPLSLDAGRSDYGRSDYGRSDYGRSDYGRSDYGSGLGRSDYGRSDYGRSDYGRSDYGRSDYGRSDYGRSDYGRGDYGRGDYGGGDLFAGDPTSPGGELDFETATDLARTPPIEFTACVIGVGTCVAPSATSGVLVGWKAPNIGGVTGYSVYRVPGATLLPGQSWVLVQGEIAAPDDAEGNYTLVDGSAGYGVQYTYFAVAKYGDGIRSDPSNLETLTTRKLSSSVTVICPAPAGGFTYNGSAQTPCSATYSTEDGGESGLPLVVFYDANTGAGSATASASYAGDANHAASSNSATFTIGQATSMVTVSCPASVTYTGSAIEGCTASYAGVGGLAGSLTLVVYANNVDVGTATASASYAGDANHAASSSSATFTIGQATSMVMVSCPASVAYTGSAIEGCTATYAGAGGLAGSLTLAYANNVNVGTATASASYAGDANHAASANLATFAIGKAASTTTVTCGPGVPYTGSAQTPCSVAVTGAGGLNLAPAPIYANNVNAGTASASYTYAGGANHAGSAGAGVFTIAKATPTFSALSGPTIFAGATPTALGGTLKAGSLIPTGSVSITLNGVPQVVGISATGAFSSSFPTGALTAAGSPYTIAYSYADDGNFAPVGPDTSKQLTVQPQYTLFGLQNVAPAALTVKAKAGSSVPMKWQFKNGSTVVNSAGVIHDVTITSSVFSNTDSGSSSFRYDATTNTWSFNLQTKSSTGAPYPAVTYTVTITPKTPGYLPSSPPITLVLTK